MVSKIKTYTTLDNQLFSDLNSEFDNIYSALNGGVSTLIGVGAVSQTNMANDANPAVYFAELFKDGAVPSTTGFVHVSSSSLDETISSGTAYVLKTSTSPDKLIRVDNGSSTTLTMVDNTTNYIDLGADGTLDVSQAANAAADHMRLLKVVTSGGSISSTLDVADRSFPDNSLPPNYWSAIQLECTAATTVVVKSGAKVTDTTGVYDITTVADLTLDITNSVGALGLDQGSEASGTWYAVVLVGDTTGAVDPSAVLVTAANYSGSIVLPSGYDIYRRVGWARNDGSSNFVQFTQIGNRVNLEDSVEVVTASTATTFTGVGLKANVPTTSLVAFLHGHMDVNSAASDLVFRVTGSGATVGIMTVSETSVGGSYVEMSLNTSQSFDFKGVSDPQHIEIFLHGYVDDLERNL